MIKFLNGATMLFLVIAYITIIIEIIQKRNAPKEERLNVVSWVLWIFLDGTGYYGTDLQGDNLTLMRTFVIGTSAVSLMLLWKGKFLWGKIEKRTLILVIICFAVSKFGTPKMIIWASGLAIFCAGIPLLDELRQMVTVPDNVKIYGSAFFIAMVCSTVATYMAGESLIIPVSGVLYWIIGGYFIFKDERDMIRFFAEEKF